MVFSKIPTPALIYNRSQLRNNINIIRHVEDSTGITILYSVKASYSILHTPEFKDNFEQNYSCSSINEVALVKKLNQKCTIHCYIVGLKISEYDFIKDNVSYVIWNSYNNFLKSNFKRSSSNISNGIRINPHFLSAKNSFYNPSLKSSRFGIPLDELPKIPFIDIEGIHVHALCAENLTSLLTIVEKITSKLYLWLPKLKWINFGGGHHLTDDNYDISGLIFFLQQLRSTYPHLTIFLEPGSAYLNKVSSIVTTILDIVNTTNNQTAILDISFKTHLSDYLIGKPENNLPFEGDNFTFVDETTKNKLSRQEHLRTYQFGGLSCATYDYRGYYLFDKPLEVGDIITLQNITFYTDVNFSYFNGINSPTIFGWDEDTGYVKYVDFRQSKFENFFGF
jgi:carboxynorspermidine decarboxylase